MTNTFIKILAALSLTFFVSACGTENKQKFESFTASYQKANYCDATDTILNETDVCNKKANEINATDFNTDEQLNAGTALFLAQKPDLSNALFSAASNSIRESFASTGIGRGTAEILVNASMVNYNPMIMDSIYLYSYTFLNALALNNKQEAKIQINRAYNLQQNAVKEFNKEIEDQKQEAAKEVMSLDTESRKENNKNIADVMNNYKEFARWKGYRDFVNPYITYLSGLYFMTNGTGNSDYETASNYLKRVQGMTIGNRFLKDDLSLANRLANGERNVIPPTAWIIFENGLVANFKEFRLDLPFFLVTKEVKTVSLALPYPNERNEAYDFISVSNGNTKVKTELLTNVDSIFIAEFYKKLPIIIGKAITKLTIQTAAQVAARKSTKGKNEGFGTFLGYAIAGYSILTSGADTRSWYSLPKNVQLAKIKKNGNKLKLYIGSKVLEVSVPKNGNSIVYIRIPTAEAVPTISMFDL